MAAVTEPTFQTATPSSTLSYIPFVAIDPTTLSEHTQPKHSDGDKATPIGRLEYLTAGKSAAVYGIDAGRVLKVYHENDFEVELRVYRRVGSHPYIATLLGTCENGSIVLERGEVLRKICRNASPEDISTQTKILWLMQAVNGYQRLHELGIIHADVGCNNLILTEDGRLKLIDFEGCSIDGEIADSCYEWCSYRPSTPRVSRRTDIFAFGCAVYEVVTGMVPYHELETSRDPYGQVEDLYAAGQFPNLEGLPLGQLIHDCLHDKFSSMAEVATSLEGCRTSPPPE